MPSGLSSRRATWAVDRVLLGREGGPLRLPSRWVVAEYAFEPGRHEIGVRTGLVTEMLTAVFADHYTARNNKRRQSSYRRYRHHYG